MFLSLYQRIISATLSQLSIRKNISVHITMNSQLYGMIFGDFNLRVNEWEPNDEEILIPRQVDNPCVEMLQKTMYFFDLNETLTEMFFNQLYNFSLPFVTAMTLNRVFKLYQLFIDNHR